MKNLFSLFFSRRGMIAAALCLVLTIPCIAFGADDESAAVDQKKDEFELPTVVVTAQKREENVQEIPMSVSVFSDQKLEASGIDTTNEMLRYVPNVYVRSVGNYSQVSMRGLRNYNASLTSPVAYFIDDVNLPSVFMQNPELFDIQRVEVLKGPQGTLYGSNSELGVINVVTKQPCNEVTGRILTEYNAYDTSHGLGSGARLGAAFSGPLVQDKLYAGFTGVWDYSQGYIKNVYTGDNESISLSDFTGRATLRWTPTSELEIRFIADGEHNDDGLGYGRNIDGPNKTGRNTVNHDIDPRDNLRADGQNLRIKYDNDSVVFTSITGRRFFRDKYTMDMESAPDPEYLRHANYDMEDQLWSQEFRLASSENTGPFEWLTGVYAHREDIRVNNVFDLAMPFPGMGIVSAAEGRDTKIDGQGIAGFGQGTYTLFGKLHLTAGVRYDYIDIKGKQSYSYKSNLPFPPTLSDYDSQISDGVVLPKGSISYDITDAAMVYATVARGYLAGGFDVNMPNSAETFKYDPEFTINYEVGAKTSWFDNKLLLNVALFYIDVKDKQVSQYIQGVTTISNAAKAHSKGFEIEMQAFPYEGWQLFGGFGYTKTEVDSWTGEQQVGSDPATMMPILAQFDRAGNELTYAPEYTYNLGVQYTHETGLFGRVELLGTGPFYHDADNEIRESAYELVNIRLGYEDDTYMVTLWGKNVFDAAYSDVKFSSGSSTIAFDGKPRQFGLTVGYKF